MSRKLIGIMPVTNCTALKPTSLPNVRSYREKDEIDDVEMTALSDLEKQSALRSRRSTMASYEMQVAEDDLSGVAGNVEMVQVNPVHVS